MAGTTMARIAVEVGLQQSSIYYYFRNRDEIAVALVAQANVVPLELVDRIIADGGSPPQMLHAFVRGDVAALCRLPFDINDIHRIAVRDRDRFAAYWQERALLERKLASIVRNGIDRGVFARVKPRLAALTIMANDEGLQNWFRLTSRGNVDESARFLADVTVRGLLASGFELADLLNTSV
jgi:TetR/AcrR family transcriptional regulator